MKRRTHLLQVLQAALFLSIALLWISNAQADEACNMVMELAVAFHKNHQAGVSIDRVVEQVMLVRDLTAEEKRVISEMARATYEVSANTDVEAIRAAARRSCE